MAHLTVKDYNAALNDCWKMFKGVQEETITIEDSIMLSDQIVKKYDRNPMVKEIVFAMWHEIDRQRIQQMDMKDELFKTYREE